MLSKNWDHRKPLYDFIVVGSGYGGAITAARIAAANLNPKPLVCILERGREWPVGSFPDTIEGIAGEIRSDINPLGLHEFLTYRDISVWKGNGLGGTSLVNANVAIVPDAEVFDSLGWPKSLNRAELMPYYQRVRETLDANPHPNALGLPKVQALKRRADQIGREVLALDIAVNFHPDGPNKHGVPQKKCTNCGDCITGCNVGAKNTLYMNYLPMAADAGAEIFTQCKVEWVEKLTGGGWRIHGRRYRSKSRTEKFTFDAANVILSAGSINTTEILLRSEMHALSVSPRLGSGFSGNGDFFAIAYNGDYRTQVLGFGNHLNHLRASSPPGPTIVGAVRYNTGVPVDQRITVEDLSFPKGLVEGAARLFLTQPGVDTDTGDETQERARALQDSDPFAEIQADGALDHTMMYLVMGIDDARGSMVFEKTLFEPDGRMRIEWDDAGRQVVFTRINEELRRHSRALGATFIENPTWSFLNLRHLVTAHPIGGCPIGEDHIQGAVDEFGRVFAGDGSVHSGLFVADGSLLPSALGVNPFLTISALSERIAERKVREMQGEAYPAPKVSVSLSGIDPVEAAGWKEAELERLFGRAESQGIDVMLNSGKREIDAARRTVHNDEYWKGFFPRGHILNAMSAVIFTGFKKRFFKQGKKYAGVTSDTDGRINARNSLEELNLKKQTGDLKPGRYILLRYVDPPWQGYYDVFKVINENLLIGRVYLGEYPNGIRMFTFPMTRSYGFSAMTVEDHRQLFASGTVPAKEELNGAWRMDVISNANQAGGLAWLSFDLKPDGRLESRYHLMGLMEGLVTPTFVADHFRLDDFTDFHDEIRKIDNDLFIGKYVTELPAAVAGLLPASSLGLLHVEGDDRKRFGMYYLLTRAEKTDVPTTTLLRPLLETHLPDGLGMVFDEEMEGWYSPGVFTSGPGRKGDLEIAARIPDSGKPAGGSDCRFDLRMTVRDLNEFIDGAEHEARASGSISFEQFEGRGPVTFPVDDRRSYFNYLRINPATGEAEMRYHLEFRSDDGRAFTFEGRKYMQKDDSGGPRAMREVLDDYTTLYCHVYEDGTQGRRELGTGYLKFRTFEDIFAVGNLAGFLRSFQVTGTDDPLLQLRGQARFLAFTGQFVQQEYDPVISSVPD